MQQFYRPSGDSTQKRGVLADVVLPSISDQMDVGEADLQHALEFDQIEKAEFNLYPYVTPEIAKLSVPNRIRESRGPKILRI